MDGFIFLVAMSIAFFNYYIYKDYRASAFIHSLLWCVIIFFQQYIPHGLSELSEEIKFIIIFSMLSFSLGSLLLNGLFTQIFDNRGVVTYVYRGHDKQHKIIVLFYVCLFICFISTPLMMQRAIALASYGSSDNFMMNLRHSLTGDTDYGGFGILSYAVLLSFSLSYITVKNIKYHRMGKGVMLFSMALSIFYAVISTGRTFLFLFLIPLSLVTSFFYSNKFKASFFISISLIMLCVFVFIGIVMNKIGFDVDSVVNAFSIYFLGGITAFDIQFHSTSYTDSVGDNVFRTFYAIFSKLGFDINVVPLIKPYVYVPMPTNVYTVFSPYYMDFGLAFIFISQFFFGLMHQSLYFFAKRNNARAIILYSISMYPLFMQFFQDQYFSLLTTWVIFSVIIIFLVEPGYKIIKHKNGMEIL